MSFGFILAIGFLLLVSLTLTTALAALRGYVLRHFGGMVGVFALTDFLLSIGLGTGLVALMYRYLPARRLPWRQVLTGALVTAVLFHLGRWAIGLYLGTRHAAHGLRRGGILRRVAAVAVLHRADLPVRRGVHRLPRPYPQATAAGETAGYFLMVNLPNAMPRSHPSPVPDSASETSPLVTTWPCADFTAPACASALA